MLIPWHWRCCIAAPTGELLPWTIANSRDKAVELLLGARVSLWPYALMNGYRVQWIKEDHETVE